MARESQGLQIALIIFVMLTVVLAVSTFICQKNYTEAKKSAIDANEQAAKDRQNLEIKDTECKDLKKFIGYENKTKGEIEELFNKDMAAYAQAYPVNERFYSLLIPRLWETLKNNAGQVVDMTAKNAELDRRFAQAEAGRVKQDEFFKKTMDDRAKEVVRVTQAYADERDALQNAERVLAGRLTGVQKKGIEIQNAADRRVKVIQEDRNQLIDTIHQEAVTIQGLQRPAMGQSCGHIGWVSNRTVWIDKGLADNLPRQIQFTVYPGDASDLKAVAKAKIEITRITGDHVAEAKIIEDKITDPIMPGDKIFSPFWSPGQKAHYAICGLMDLNGDGRNEAGTVRGLITSNGGEVDCEMDEGGRITGKIGVDTQRIVLGTRPGPKSPKDYIEGWNRMMSDTKQFAVREITLDDLKKEMNYQKSGGVERFGRENNVSTAAPKAAASKPATPPAKPPSPPIRPPRP